MFATARRTYGIVQQNTPIMVLTGLSLTGGDGGVPVGYLDRVTFRQGRVHLVGWYGGVDLTVQIGQDRRILDRTIKRSDIALVRPDLGTDATLGFDLDLPWTGESVAVILQDGSQLPLDLPDRAQTARWRMRSLGRIARVGVTHGPGVLLDRLRGRAIDRAALRRQLGMVVEAPRPRVLDDRLFAVRNLPAVPADCSITVILPVYNAFDLLQEALRRLVANTDLPWHLIAIEDCSSDQRVRPWLRDWAATRGDRVTLLENDQNLGFVGSVNRAFSIAPGDRPLILLNSDALVPDRWASRIIAPLLADPDIASVTPMSNDATIFSVPLIGLSSSIPEGLGDRLDQTARCLSDALTDPAPTGVGFCMAISARALATVGRFDTAFGKGYGEEVDWCQKVRAAGMRNVGIGNLFVEHAGGQSFGSATKTAQMRASGQIISTRYPRFDLEVQKYIAADPLCGHRLALALAWSAGIAADQGRQLPVYIGHSLGGGADSWLTQAITADLASGVPAVVLRLGGPVRFKIELHVPGNVSSAMTGQTTVLRQLMAPLSGHRFIYSCGVGDPHGIEIPDLIRDLAGPDGRTEVLFHDYWPISPSYTLVDTEGAYHGAPAPDSTDRAHQSQDAHGGVVSLRDWQEKWGRLVTSADEVRVFSESSAGIVGQIWPQSRDRLVVSRHAVRTEGLEFRDPHWLTDTPGTIAVLGAIGAYKGAAYISKIAAAFRGRPDAPRLVVIGEFDLSFPLPSSVVVTGRYRHDDLPALIQTHRVQAWLMPSVVPETFSFATHEMLATGLPVMAFDLGAQGDAVAAAPNGHILPDRSPETLLQVFQRVTGKAR